MTPPPRKPKLAADPVQRFAADLTAVAGAAAVDRERFGVAVSGGPDSMALLWLAHQRLGTRCFAATVDHGLRPEAADEAAMVAQWCAVQGIEHIILTPTAAITGSLQAAARKARYALLGNWRTTAKLDWLLTAHHADDQLETLLMRLNRSSGVGGLAGIRARNGAVLRPLLGWSHAELLAICRENSLPYCLDPSNGDDHFDRVRMRKSLAAVDWLDPLAAATSAGALNDADLALDWAADHLISTWPDRDDAEVLRIEGYPIEIQRRVVAKRLKALDPDLPVRGDAMTGLLAQMGRGKAAMIGNWQIISVSDATTPFWRIIRAPERKGLRRD